MTDTMKISEPYTKHLQESEEKKNEVLIFYWSGMKQIKLVLFNKRRFSDMCQN